METVLLAASFGPYFCTWIRFLYVSYVMPVEANVVFFHLSRLSIFEFASNLKANQILHWNSLPGATTLARYSVCANDVSVLVSNRAEIDKLAEIEVRDSGVVAMINCDVGLPLGMWKGVSLPEHFLWTDRMVKIFGLDLLLEMNWSEVLEKAEAAVHLQSWRNLFLMGEVESMCFAHLLKSPLQTLCTSTPSTIMK